MRTRIPLQRLFHRPYSSASATSIPIASRPLPTLHDFISPTNSHLLRLSLNTQLPFIPKAPRGIPSFTSSDTLPAGHHLIYFPPQLPESLLLHDGSDAEQNPGDPYTRRMWAGGDLKFSLGRDGRGVRFYDQAIMKERVESVKPRGEKLFVWFERRIWSAQQNGEKLGQPLPEDGQDVRDGEEKVIERRCLVFMPSVSPDAPKATPVKAQEMPYTPDVKYTFLPSPHLLFRYSALTFNAHRIHYDVPYTQKTEGHPAPLVHGPLAVTLLMELCSAEFTEGGKKMITGFEYRCQSPMYMEKPYTVAGKDLGDGRVELFVVNEKGGIAVRGIATVA